MIAPTTMPKATPSESCLIIGAGIAGLSAAGLLHRHGVAVTVLDKASGVGGRMATRRMATRRIAVDHKSDAAFDHGAQFLTARSESFKAAIEQWQEAGVAREWFRGRPGSASASDHHPRFCGVGGMTSIPKYLARDFEVELEAAVEGIEQRGSAVRGECAAVGVPEARRAAVAHVEEREAPRVVQK